MIHNLFPTAVCHFSLEEEKRNKQTYLDFLYNLKAKDKGHNRSNVYSWHSSSNINILKDKEFVQLLNFIQDSVKSAIGDMGYDKIKLFLYESWSIISPKGAYNKSHNHPGGFISGSYYVSNPSSPITFYDPRSIKSFSEPRGMSKITPYNTVTVSIKPKEGDLILFPSWLEHSVSENKTKQERVIISFNFSLA